MGRGTGYSPLVVVMFVSLLAMSLRVTTAQSHRKPNDYSASEGVSVASGEQCGCMIGPAGPPGVPGVPGESA